MLRTWLRLVVVIFCCMSCAKSTDIDLTDGGLLYKDSSDYPQYSEKRVPIVLSNGDPEYLATYKINARIEDGSPIYKSGYFQYHDLKIAVHVYLPKNPIGTIFLLHGYFDHAGSLSFMINAALKRNYAIMTYDLPGHGNSSGKWAILRVLTPMPTLSKSY